MYDDGNGSWVKVSTQLSGTGNVNAGCSISSAQIASLIPANANFFFYIYVEAGADQLLTREGNGIGIGGDNPDYMAIFNCSTQSSGSVVCLYSYGNTMINNLSFVNHVN